jgi:hypothetical protein
MAQTVQARLALALALFPLQGAAMSISFQVVPAAIEPRREISLQGIPTSTDPCPCVPLPSVAYHAIHPTLPE